MPVCFLQSLKISERIDNKEAHQGKSLEGLRYFGKKIPAKNEISGFKRDLHLFLQRDFLIFAFECLISTRGSKPKQGA